MRKYGISLVEIIAIFLAIMVLAVILFPLFRRMVKVDFGVRTDCQSHQKQIALATQLYAQDHLETMPGAMTTPALNTWGLSNFPIADKFSWRRDIGVNAKIYKCQVSRLSGAQGDQAVFGYNATLLGAKLKNIPNPDSTILTADTFGNDLICSPKELAARHAGGYIASFADGHVEYNKTLPSDPNPLDLHADNVVLSNADKTNFILDGSNVLTVKSDGTATAVTSTGLGNFYANSYLNIHVKSNGTGKPVDVLQLTGAGAHHVTHVTLPASAAAGDDYVIKLPPSGLAVWKLVADGKGPATLTPTAKP